MRKGLYAGSELSNEEYHADLEHYSSSQVKDAISDPEYFHKKYILKEIPRKSNPAFDIGTYYHTAILEPETLEDECVVYRDSKIRSGKKWTEFKEANEGKVILTVSELAQAENLIKATQASDIAMDLVSTGTSELSCFATLMGTKIRVRADTININSGYISDLKSTTGSAKDTKSIQGKIANFNYDMSAALYIDTFNAHYGSEVIRDFYWIFASKDYGNCKTYKASKKMLEVGRAKYRRGLQQIKKYKTLGWEFPDEIEDIDPVGWDAIDWEPNKDLGLI